MGKGGGWINRAYFLQIWLNVYYKNVNSSVAKKVI